MSDEVVKEKIDNLEEQVIMGLLGGFALINSGGMEFIKSLMQ